MNYEELVKSRKNIGDMTKEELFTYCGGLLSEVWDYEKENIDLQNQLQQKENIIKEVREEIIKYKEILEIGAEQNVFYIYLDSPIQKLEELLEILDKAGDSNERNKDNK